MDGLVPCNFNNIKFSSDLNLPATNNNNYMIKNDTNNENGYIPIKKLTLGSIIGRGEFASVFKGNQSNIVKKTGFTYFCLGVYLKSNNEVINVAIKTLHNELDANREAFLSEAEVMMKLNHHCIVKFIGLSLGPPLLMVQELISVGSMLSYLLLYKEKINPNYEFKIWAAQIACGKFYFYFFFCNRLNLLLK